MSKNSIVIYKVNPQRDPSKLQSQGKVSPILRTNEFYESRNIKNPSDSSLEKHTKDNIKKVDAENIKKAQTSLFSLASLKNAFIKFIGFQSGDDVRTKTLDSNENNLNINKEQITESPKLFDPTKSWVNGDEKNPHISPTEKSYGFFKSIKNVAGKIWQEAVDIFNSFANNDKISVNESGDFKSVNQDDKTNKGSELKSNLVGKIINFIITPYIGFVKIFIKNNKDESLDLNSLESNSTNSGVLKGDKNGFNPDDSRNLINQKFNKTYRLSDDDVIKILGQRNSDSDNPINILPINGASLNDDVKIAIENAILEANFNDKPQYFIINENKSHWTCCAIVKYKDELIILYKNSLGGDCLKPIMDHINGISTAFEINISYKKNNVKEQTDDYSCGIFAVNNILQIKREVDSSKDLLVENFEDKRNFSQQANIADLRIEYAQDVRNANIFDIIFVGKISDKNLIKINLIENLCLTEDKSKFVNITGDQRLELIGHINNDIEDIIDFMIQVE